MKTDFHVHTSFSKDSEANPEVMIQAAIQKGIKTICITDHLDLDFAEPGFEIDFEKYFSVLNMLQKKYSACFPCRSKLVRPIGSSHFRRDTTR